MAQTLSSVENNFTKGLITEATGLNFPENAATDASNCDFTIIGDVTRRLGVNKEVNGIPENVSSFSAMTDFVWNNPGGQSNKTLLVKQVEGLLLFYDVSAATTTSPLSTQLLVWTITLANFAAPGINADPTIECQFAEGNGYLFVYQSSCQPFYCTYVSGVISGNIISVQIRDFAGTSDGLAVNARPPTLSDAHLYNLQNQGWTQQPPWVGSSTTSYTTGSPGTATFTIQAGLSISGGTVVTVVYSGSGAPQTSSIPTGAPVALGTVTSYTSGSGVLVINVTQVLIGFNATGASWVISPSSTGNIGTFAAAAAAYPSNADVWWYFKDSTGAFVPSTTLGNVTLASGNAPQGHYILDAFVLNRALVSQIASIDTVRTLKRPSTGTWWQGRVWYTGLNDATNATSTTAFYTWNSNIYFSTTVQTTTDFGVCYQTNDPTSENLNGILPTDGGVITIPETGTIHKLFPIQNGLLVFANNGIWFITGSQGIGFAANDYTITKISSIRTLSHSSFVDVMGLPFFWNEEGIYQVTPSQNNSLTVEPITVGTILTYYSNIPIQSKKYARGAYDPINYILQWTYRSTVETDVNNRYFMDTILNYNVYNKAFYPYNLPQMPDNTSVAGVVYITYPVITAITPLPGFKYPFSALTNTSSRYVSYAEFYDENYVDWGSVDYDSYFVVGFKLHGGAWRKFQVPYTYVYSRTDGDYSAYYIQGLWDYASNSDSNKWSTPQFTEIFESNRVMVARRHRIRGRGLVLQLKVSSVSGQPFDIMGWAMYETTNTGA